MSTVFCAQEKQWRVFGGDQGFPAVSWIRGKFMLKCLISRINGDKKAKQTISALAICSILYNRTGGKYGAADRTPYLSWKERGFYF
jgi:hypothetical protein